MPSVVKKMFWMRRVRLHSLTVQGEKGSVTLQGQKGQVTLQGEKGTVTLTGN